MIRKTLTFFTVFFLTVSLIIPVGVEAGLHKPDPAMLYDAINELEAIDYDGLYTDIIENARKVAQSAELTYTMLGEQLDIFDGIRKGFREKLNQLLNEADERGMFDTQSAGYAICSECELIWKDENKTITEYYDAYNRLVIAIVSEDLDPEILSKIQDTDNYWKYNYPDGADKMFRAAVNSVLEDYAAEKLNLNEISDEIKNRIEQVPTLKTYRVGSGTAFDGWTTQQVQNVVNKSDKVCESIGTGLNTRNVYNGGDFSSKTQFSAGDGWFAMKATGDFSNKAMGWKNMDRNGTITGTPMAASPALGMNELENAEGIRFKLEMSEGGSVERILIGLSNCCTITIESYAMNIKPEYVGPDGYINIPFSYFEDAWWAGTDYKSNRGKTIVFIAEAYGVSQGTELKFSDMQGYTTQRPVIPATKEQIDELSKAVSDMLDLLVDEKDKNFATYTRLANDAMSGGMSYDIEDATKKIKEVTALYEGREDVKNKIKALIQADTDGYIQDRIENYKKTYYDSMADSSDLQSVIIACENDIKLLGYDAPEIIGIEDGKDYDLRIEKAPVLNWSDGEATLNGEKCEKNTIITEPGKYTLNVSLYFKSVSAVFTVSDSSTVPVIIGVEDFGIYDIHSEQAPEVSWDAGEATLNGEPFESGTVIDVAGDYVLKIVNGSKSVEITFTVIDTTPEPKISGVEAEKEYDIYKGEYVSISWTPEQATAILNGDPYKAGTIIDIAGDYKLVVTNGSKTKEISFSVTDTATMPVITGIEDGKEYDIYLGEVPSATWDIGKATLNGELYVAGTPIETVGEYTLTVVNGSQTAIIHFKVSDSTPPYTPGDFDDDGEITVADALSALRIAAKLAAEDEMSLAIGDTDKDGSVTVADALAILRVAAKLTDSFG